jgi:hypothetical protein
MMPFELLAGICRNLKLTDARAERAILARARAMMLQRRLDTDPVTAKPNVEDSTTTRSLQNILLRMHRRSRSIRYTSLDCLCRYVQARLK